MQPGGGVTTAHIHEPELEAMARLVEQTAG